MFFAHTEESVLSWTVLTGSVSKYKPHLFPLELDAYHTLTHKLGLRILIIAMFQVEYFPIFSKISAAQ